MDANGLHFALLADEARWHFPEQHGPEQHGPEQHGPEQNGPEQPAQVRWDPARRSLRLASRRSLPAPVAEEPPVDDAERLARVPQAVDPFGARAFWEGDTARVRVASADLPAAISIYEPPAGDPVTDLALGHDGVLYLAVGGRLVVEDRRERWAPAVVEDAELAVWRLATLAEGGVWVLDRDNRRLAKVEGLPLPHRPPTPWAATTWRPTEENPDPPRVTLRRDLDLEAGETPIALAAAPGRPPRGGSGGETRRLALLTRDAGGAGRLRLVGGDGSLAPPLDLLRAAGEALLLPFSLAWLDDGRLAVMAPGLAEAPVYDPVSGGSQLLPGGGLHPLRDHDGGPFAHTVEAPPHYPTGPGSTLPLHRLSLPSFARRGTALGALPLDGGRHGTVWHRLYLEAAIPPRCGLRVDLATSEVPEPPDGDAWHPHYFGAAGVPEVADPMQQPVRGVWSPEASELPFHPGLLACPRERDRAGLFTALVQRRGRRVSAIKGRYLWVRVEFLGDGRTSPELAALRAWAGRFSYGDHYLPELYQEHAFGPDADAAGAPTGADFLERFLGNLEGFLTPLEDRIAHADLLSDPRTVPADALEWLAGWIGLAFEPGYPEDRRRTLLRAAPELYRWRGTLRGLELALDVATDGAVRGGEVVVLEDFRLRRTFATILGADLAAEEDPLLPGLIVSGNSFVGDTLILGREEKREFLALFRPDLEPGAETVVSEFFERLAHRVTVLVHQAVEPQDLKLIRRVVGLEVPAHVEAKVVPASHPLLVGLAALVGVDTYLAARPAPRAVELDRSRLGGGDRLARPPGLDPRLGGGDPQQGWPPRGGSGGGARPVADAGSHRTVELGDPWVLDGSCSHAAFGRTLVRYHWTLVESKLGD